MQIAKSFMICAFALVSVNCATGQKIDTHQLKSEILDGERTVQVWLPEDYDVKKKYATIFVFDGEYLFNATCAVAEIEMMYEKIPPSIVVGIHFKKDQRNFDMGINWNGDGQLNRNGTNFYQYVKSELIPFVRKRSIAEPCGSVRILLEGESRCKTPNFTNTSLAWNPLGPSPTLTWI